MPGSGGMSAGDIHGLAQEQTRLDRPNVYSPVYGSTTWQQDPNHPDTYTETQSLSPYMQQRFDLAQRLMGNVAGEMKPLDMSGIPDLSMDPNFEANQQQQAYKFAAGNMDPQWAIQEQQLKGQMAAQGLHPGDPGYNQAMNQFQNQKQQAYGQANAGAYQTGVQAGATRMNTAVQSMQAQIAEQLQKSGWSLGQINALMAGMPGAPQGQQQQSGLLQAGMQNSLAQQAMNSQMMNNIIGGGASLGGAAIIGTALAGASDVNVKENFTDPAPALEEFLQSAEPSEYNYKADSPFPSEGRHISPMAQNLEKSAIGRSMVIDTPVGKAVDYGKSFGAVLGALSHLNKKLNSVMGL